MNQFKTIKKTDPLFKKYIWGQFSETEQAIPLAKADSDEVTFQIIPNEKISKPSLFKIIFLLTKWNYFYLLFTPMYFVFVKNTVYHRLFDIQSFILSIISSIFLCSGLNIRNEVIDHITGYDQAVLLGTPKPIPQGWITAWKARQISWVFIIISIFTAIPVFMAQIEALKLSVVTAILFLLGDFFYKNNYKYKVSSELVLLILLGPALTAGYQVSLGSGIDTEVLVFGLMWGVASMFLVYIVQFANIFETSQAQIKNTITKLGFDKSKTFLKWWWRLFILLWFVYHYFYSSLYWNIVTNLILIFWSLPTFIKIAEIQSPIGSKLKTIRKIGFRNFYLMMFIIIAEQTWYLINYLEWVH